MGLVGPISASAFIGPSAGQTPGSGGGLFQVDANRNIGFGAASSTPVSTFDNVGGGGGESHGYVFLVASTTNPGLGLRNASLGHLYLWSVRNIGSKSRIDLYRESALPGKILMSIDETGFVGISAAPTSTYRLYVGEGNIGTTGAFVGTISGNASAANVTGPSAFGTNYGTYNYAFPGALAVGTTTTVGLPTNGLFVLGNVGIGTTGPTSIFDIDDNAATGTGLIVRGGGLGGNLATFSRDIGASTTVGINGANGDAQLYFTTASNTFVIGADGNNFKISDSTTFGTNDRFTIDNAGNVGIGTSTPESIGGGYGTLDIRGSNGGGIVVGKSSAERAFYYSDASFAYLGSWSNLPLRIQTNNTDRIRIDTAGNVGIATTTPVYMLDVVGTGRFTGQLTVPTPSADTSAATKAYVDSIVGGGSGSGSFSTLSVSGTSTLATSAGNVGIGTTAPLFKYHLSGSSNLPSLTAVAGIAAFDTNSTVELTMGGYTATPYGFWLQTKDNQASGLGTGGSYPLLLNPIGGNVGIGTINPSQKLEVQGNIVVPNNNPTWIGLNSTSNWQVSNSGVGLIGQNNVHIVFDSDNNATTDYLDIGKDSSTIGSQTSLVRILESGRVGIASSSPGYALTVVGTGYFSQPVIVGTPTQTSHAATKDYVDSAVTSGTASSSANSAACSADATCEVNSIDAQGGNITGVNKLTVATIDPLYQIGGVKYSTYAASIAGGVKEEYVGSAKLSYYNKKVGEYEYVVDFDEMNDGSSLWVWRKTVEFGKDTVQVLMTPYGASANLYYLIQGNKLVFRGDKSVEFSYRLIGNRFDWRSWPTLAKDQTEKPSLIINQ